MSEYQFVEKPLLNQLASMGWQVDENLVTGEQNPEVNIIDFDHWEANRFLAINQYRIDTPGGVKECILLDVVLLVNGLPLVEKVMPGYEAQKSWLKFNGAGMSV